MQLRNTGEINPPHPGAKPIYRRNADLPGFLLQYKHFFSDGRAFTVNELCSVRPKLGIVVSLEIMELLEAFQNETEQYFAKFDGILADFRRISIETDISVVH